MVQEQFHGRTPCGKLLSAFVYETALLSALAAPFNLSTGAASPEGTPPAAAAPAAERRALLSDLTAAAEAADPSESAQRARILPPLVSYAESLSSAKGAGLDELRSGTALLRNLCMARYSQGFSEAECSEFFTPVWTLCDALIKHLREIKPSDFGEEKNVAELIGAVHEEILFSGFHKKESVLNGAAESYRRNFLSGEAPFSFNWPSNKFIGAAGTYELTILGRALLSGREELAAAYQAALLNVNDLEPRECAAACRNLLYLRRALRESIGNPVLPVTPEERCELSGWFRENIECPFSAAAWSLGFAAARVYAAQANDTGLVILPGKEPLSQLWWESLGGLNFTADQCVSESRTIISNASGDPAARASYYRLLQGVPRSAAGVTALESLVREGLAGEKSPDVVVDGIGGLISSLCCEDASLVDVKDLDPADELRNITSRLKGLHRKLTPPADKDAPSPNGDFVLEIFSAARSGRIPAYAANSVQALGENRQAELRAVQLNFLLASHSALSELEAHTGEIIARRGEEATSYDLFYPSAARLFRPYAEPPSEFSAFCEAASSLRRLMDRDLLAPKSFGTDERALAEIMVTMMLCEARRNAFAADQAGRYGEMLRRLRGHFPGITVSDFGKRYSSRVGGVYLVPPVQVEGEFAPFEAEYFYTKEMLYTRKYGRSSTAADAARDGEIVTLARTYAEARQRHFAYMLSLRMLARLEEFSALDGDFRRAEHLRARLDALNFFSNVELRLEFDKFPASNLTVDLQTGETSSKQAMERAWKAVVAYAEALNQ